MATADHPLKQRFVLDTSALLTNEIRRDDETLDETLQRYLDLVARAKLRLNISCYMPPSIHRELTTMLEERNVSDETFSKLNTWIIRKNPAYHEVPIPADVVVTFIEEMSDRVNRGLRVSERAVREANESREEPIDDHDYKTEVDQVITDLRDKYRRTLRQGVLDSREDFDLLVLAREMEAGVVTEDQGIIDWAEDFGLRHMKGREFPDLLAEYLQAQDRIAAAERSTASNYGAPVENIGERAPSRYDDRAARDDDPPRRGRWYAAEDPPETGGQEQGAPGDDAAPDPERSGSRSQDDAERRGADDDSDEVG